MEESKGVVAVVGCGLGLGGALASKFAKEGFTIAAMARSSTSLDAVRQMLAAVGDGKHGFYTVDATQKDEVDAAFEKVAAELGPVCVMIYNVSDTPKALRTTVLDIDPEDYTKSFKLNALGALLCTQAVLPRMLASEGSAMTKGVAKKGTILYTSASSAFRSTNKSGAAAAGKMALRGLSQAVAKEYAKQGIHAVHVRMDCTYESPKNKSMFEANGFGDAFEKMSGANQLASIDDLADTYFALHAQSPMAWTNEIDLRPYTEDWTY